MDSNSFEKEQYSLDGMDTIPELNLENYKEYNENKRNIDDFVRFLEAIQSAEDLEEIVEYEIPFSLN